MSQSARLVQSGEGDRRFVVLLYLIHPDRDPALREALGPKPMILARADDGDPGPTIWEDVAPHFKPGMGDVAGFVLGTEYQTAFVFLVMVALLVGRNLLLERQRKHLA
jgi:hypothetical protein